MIELVDTEKYEKKLKYITISETKLQRKLKIKKEVSIAVFEYIEIFYNG